MEKYPGAINIKKKEIISCQWTTFMVPNVVCTLLVLAVLSKSNFRNSAGKSYRDKKITGYEEKMNLGSDIIKSGCW